MPLFQLGQDRPQVHPSVFVAPGAMVVGKVELHENSSIWFNVSLRGDNDLIVLGEGSNIQEGSVLHTDTGCPLIIGKRVTVGHQAMLHGCTIGDESLIGMQAILLNGAQVGRHCIIGAGALVTGNTVIPEGSMVLGSPAKVVRPLKPEEIEMIRQAAAGYVDRAKLFNTELIALDGTEGMSRQA
jgi:carbonic anhydrase/acetyltransferase-like protein (isoleucine patch superfamily)